MWLSVGWRQTVGQLPWRWLQDRLGYAPLLLAPQLSAALLPHLMQGQTQPHKQVITKVY